MKVINYEPYIDRKSLIGHFALHLPEWDLIIEHMCEFKKDDRRWIAPPCYKKENEDGSATFVPYLRFSPATNDRFLKAAREALDEYLSLHKEDVPF